MKARAKPSVFERAGRGAGPLGAFIGIAVAAVALGLALGALVRPGAAQEPWSPIVVTSPGGTLNMPDEATAHTRIDIDPSHFPSPRSPVRATPRPLPQGVWSPLITGAIPQDADATGLEAEDAAPEAGQDEMAMPRFVPPAALSLPSPPAAVLQPGTRPAAVVAQNATPPPAAEPPAQPAAAPADPTPAAAGDADPDSVFKQRGPLDALPPNATAAQQYCFNTTDSAADARFAWQAQKIKDMETELEKRVQRLQAKTEEYKAWLERRDAFARKAHEKLVGFYARMRPDAAAVQLATLDENIAAAVMTKLETKVASQIMGEMEPERAAKIATIISGAAKVPQTKEAPKAAQPPGEAAPAAPAATAPAAPAATAPAAPADQPRS